MRRIFFSIKTGRVFSGASSYEEEEELLDIPVEIMREFGKPVVIIAPEELSGRENLDLEDDRRRIRDYFFAHNIPVFLSEQRAFAALSHLAAFRTAHLERAGMAEATSVASLERRASFLEIVRTSPTRVLDERRSKKIIKEYGIEVTEPILAQSREAAVAAAEKIGWPVAMKLVSPHLTHKSDVGGVKIGLADRDDVLRAYEEIMASAAEKAPDAVIEGVAVQKMALPGLELVVGMNKDAQFGPVLMFGLGGTLVEILGDVSFRIAPLARRDARAMIREIRAYRLLEGYRGQPPVDVTYIEELLLKVSRLVVDNPEIKEMDINPLVAYAEGATAVDARIILEDQAVGKLGE
jgi:acyl-CoA synthetase (NDP forming)